MVTNSRYSGRKLRNNLFIVASTGAAVIGIAFLTIILWDLVTKGISALSPELFTEITMPPDEKGGLANAIVGSLVLVVLATFVGTPIGMLTGTYLAEYGRHTKLAMILRSLNDILLSAPSIVIGLFIYTAMVANMGHFSAYAGVLALAVIVIPVVVRTTENMLLLVPNGLREAASALGAPSAYVIRHVTWKAARTGIVTGVLLAVARISGETAPLLFTSLNNSFWSIDVTKPFESMNEPIATLPYVIAQYAGSPYKSWNELAWGGALLITVTVLGISILARYIGTERK